jgi:hypothetical protein
MAGSAMGRRLLAPFDRWPGLVLAVGLGPDWRGLVGLHTRASRSRLACAVRILLVSQNATRRWSRRKYEGRPGQRARPTPAGWCRSTSRGKMPPPRLERPRLHPRSLHARSGLGEAHPGRIVLASGTASVGRSNISLPLSRIRPAFQRCVQGCQRYRGCSLGASPVPTSDSAAPHRAARPRFGWRGSITKAATTHRPGSRTGGLSGWPRFGLAGFRPD